MTGPRISPPGNVGLWMVINQRRALGSLACEASSTGQPLKTPPDLPTATICTGVSRKRVAVSRVRVSKSCGIVIQSVQLREIGIGEANAHVEERPGAGRFVRKRQMGSVYGESLIIGRQILIGRVDESVGRARQLKPRDVESVVMIVNVFCRKTSDCLAEYPCA